MKKIFKKNEILVLSLLLSACSILYELMLANVLSLITGNQVLWQSLTVAVFIGGLGYGAFFSGKIDKPLKALIRVEIALAILGAISLYFIYALYGFININKYLLFMASGYDGHSVIASEFGLDVSYLIITQFLSFIVGFFTGLELPLILKINEQENIGISEGEILGANYFGTLVGTILFSFYLKPNFDLIGSSVLTGFFNYLIMIYLVFKLVKSVFVKSATVIGLVFFFVLIQLNQPFLNAYLKFHYYLPRFTFQDRVSKDNLVSTVLDQQDIEREKSLYQYLDIVKYKSAGEFTFSLDQHFQFNSKNEIFYHQAFAHIPIFFRGEVPRNVLVLGAGDGLLVRELVRYPEVEKITNVELDSAVVKKAKEDPRFLRLNKGSYFDKRVNVEIGDGFYFVRNTINKYDAVYVDFPYPNNFDLARLYSVEIYRFIAKSLNPNGFLILDAPMEKEEDSQFGVEVMETPFTPRDELNNSILLSTLDAAGFKYLYPFEVNGETFIIASLSTLDFSIDFQSIINRKMFHDQVFTKVQKIRSQKFPHRINQRFINSVFSPKLGLSGL